MAPKSGFFTTNGTGDAGTGYSLTDWQRVLKMLYNSDSTVEALVQGYGSTGDCTCTITGANQVTVSGGGGIVNGYWYEEPSSTAFTVASVSLATRKDLIVLKLDTTAQTIRLAYKSGTEGGAVPGVTQSGSTWEVAIWEVWMAVGGTITLTDRRHYLKDALANIISADGSTLQLVSNIMSIKDNGVTSAKIAANAVTSAKIATDAVGAAQIAAGAVGNAELADLAVTTAKLADGAVTTAKLAGGILNVGTRTGGDANDWTVPGSSTYTPASQRAYVDVFQLTFSSFGVSNTVTRTFPTPFTKKAIVIPMLLSNTLYGVIPSVLAITSNNFQALATTPTGAAVTGTITVMCLIIGE